MKTRALAAAGLVLLAAGCAGPRPRDIGNSFCAARAERPALEVPPARPGQVEAVVARGVTRDAAEMAQVIGALDPLQSLLEAERRGDGMGFLLARQAVTDRILLATLDVNASLAAIDCEGERGDSLRGQLQRIEDRRARRLGLASILLGATTAAVSGGLGLAGAEVAGNVVGIVGGATEASLGGALLYGSSSGRLRTRSNPLGEIWRRPERSTIFPPTVWRYLTRRDGPGARSIADDILQEWREAGLFTGDDPLFAAEGEFSTGDLERRDSMLDLLEARIALMSRDLRVLLEQVVARPPPASLRRPARGSGPP